MWAENRRKTRERFRRGIRRVGSKEEWDQRWRCTREWLDQCSKYLSSTLEHLEQAQGQPMK